MLHGQKKKEIPQSGGVINWEVGIGICTLLYMGWMINGDLLCGVESSIQYSVVTYMGKESEKEWLYVRICIAESLCCTPEN